MIPIPELLHTVFTFITIVVGCVALLAVFAIETTNGERTPEHMLRGLAFVLFIACAATFATLAWSRNVHLTALRAKESPLMKLEKPK